MYVYHLCVCVNVYYVCVFFGSLAVDKLNLNPNHTANYLQGYATLSSSKANKIKLIFD